MFERNQEAYQTLGWIVKESEQGLFLVVADETVQEEIVRFYKQGTVGIYDYKQHPGAYMFRDLQTWVTELPEARTFMVVNFHLAVQNEEDLKRLNFSRDMLEGLGKNIIFFTTQNGDDRLACKAYDFYSFVKLRVIFHSYVTEWEKENELFSMEEDFQESEWEPEKSKERLKKTYILLEQARERFNDARYEESEKLLLRARAIREKLLGAEHLEVARVDDELAKVCIKQEKYHMAEILYEEILSVYGKVLGEEHPDTAIVYNNLADVYQKQGEYRKAEEFHKKNHLANY